MESTTEDSKYLYRGDLSNAWRLRNLGFRAVDSRGGRNDLQRSAPGSLYHGLRSGMRDPAGRFGEDIPEWLRRLRGRKSQILGSRSLPRVSLKEICADQMRTQ